MDQPVITPDDHNPIFKIASDFVNHTDRSVFLTGKAGSGKTTFLKYIIGHTQKNAVVVAPTGVAAINAGGVTMHSFFQLPFGPFIPGAQKRFNGVEVSDSYSLFKNIRFSADKRELLRELELLIIDEVSMVRCDMLDAMDAILRYFRKSPEKPFGGVQVLYIGDLFQLPPVAKNEEWEILKDFYESPFFFHSQAVLNSPPLYIELKKIYRQSDEKFIELLNRVRNNNISNEDIQLLNSKLNNQFSPIASENYITLCTHNYKADTVNATELAKLRGTLYRFRGSIEGDFSEKALPTEMDLQLKEGAQVIFIKNDSDPQKRYYNGKIAVVKVLTDNEIRVRFPDNGQELKIEKETWRNIRYAYDREKEAVEEEEIGSFSQFPIRLAWAITIHKSQGLTFEKAILDAGSSFAAGQVYVALSRCTTLDGVVLHSKIQPQSISTDERVIEFARKEHEAVELERLLELERQRFWAERLLLTFDFRKLIAVLENFLEELPGKKLPDVKSALTLGNMLLAKTKEKQEVARKFHPELNKLLSSVSQAGTTMLEERVRKAIVYFSDFFKEELLHPLLQHEISLGKATRVKKYLKLVGGVKYALTIQIQKLHGARYGDLEIYKVTDEENIEIKNLKEAIVKKKKKAEKGSSLKETLAFYRAGKNIDEIAKARKLAASTVEGHLALLVKSGELDIHELMNGERLEVILHAIHESDGTSVTNVKQILGAGYSYGEIRAVLNYEANLKVEDNK
ncbi:MAG: helix-turn-helix domain-containing protein [Bacteroidia bacterium]|nr:helix-turn-helix domain-containing protein [Bacteroidia bacterium]